MLLLLHHDHPVTSANVAYINTTIDFVSFPQQQSHADSSLMTKDVLVVAETYKWIAMLVLLAVAIAVELVRVVAPSFGKKENPKPMDRVQPPRQTVPRNHHHIDNHNSNHNTTVYSQPLQQQQPQQQQQQHQYWMAAAAPPHPPPRISLSRTAAPTTMPRPKVVHVGDTWDSPLKSFAKPAIMRTVSSAASLAHLAKVSSSASLARLSQATLNWITGDRRQRHVAALSAPECFVPTTLVAQLTLHDIALLTRYAMDCNKHHHQEDMDAHDAVLESSSSLNLKTVLAGIKAAVAKSRGPGTARSSLSPFPHDDDEFDEAGNMDALWFGAAMRLFVEWRLLRQVPQGYKAYSLGVTMGRRDLIQNLAKLETAVHEWIDYHKSYDETGVGSPTIRQLLQHEAALGVHPHLPKLKDKTAAMSILWMRRQAQYQSNVYDNILHIPDKYPTPFKAGDAAYKSSVAMYHNWGIQQIFNYAHRGGPPMEILYRLMNPKHLNLVKEYAQNPPMVRPPLQEDTNQDSFVQNSPVSASQTDEESNPSRNLVERPISIDKDSLQPVGMVGRKLWVDMTPGAMQTGMNSDSSDDEDERYYDEDDSFPECGVVGQVGYNLAKGWEDFAQNILLEWWDNLISHIARDHPKRKQRRLKSIEQDDIGFKPTARLETAEPTLPLAIQPPRQAQAYGPIHNKANEQPQHQEQEHDYVMVDREAPPANEEKTAEPTRRSLVTIPDRALSGEALTRYLNDEMAKAARFDIEKYLAVMQPLLQDLTDVIDEFGMDDPTRV